MYSIEFIPWPLVFMLIGGGVFLFAAACVIYVAFRFLSLVLTLDMAMLREFKYQAINTGQAISTASQAVTSAEEAMKANSVQPSKLREFIAARMSPTQGDFTPYSEEEAFINESVEHLRRQGLNDDELDAFVRQAVGTDIGKPENNG